MRTLSHELRNPINVILGFTELLVNGTYGAVSDRQKPPPSRIDLGGRQLLSLINDVLDLAKVKAGRLQLDEVPLEASAVIHAAVAQVSLSAESKGIDLVEVVGPPVNFKADARRVHQVLLNLLSNAIKFTSAGGTVRLGWIRTRAEVPASRSRTPDVASRPTSCARSSKSLVRLPPTETSIPTAPGWDLPSAASWRRSWVEP